GEFLLFDVKVLDDNSVKQVYNEKPEGRAPQLNFVPIVRGRRDLSSYLQQLQVLPEEDTGEDGLWTFKLALDLRDQDVVRGVDDFQFGIVAISRFGVKSLTEKVDLKVVNRVSEPVITWDSDIEAKVGEHLVFNFDVFSPKSVVDITGGPNASIDEKVELNQFTCGGVFVNDCKCNTVVRGFRRIHCTVNRVLQVGDEGRYDFHISATVKNPYEPRDNRQFKVMRRIAVQPAGTSSLGSGSKGGLE
ncbi:MAG: hypothetical protein KDD61_10805, partial [Bdellovibrionales bacterium]|nr:hypothetical protein [Bdellovibrionales bacterium]